MTGQTSLTTRCRTGLALSASIAALAISHNAQAQAALCPSGQPGPVCVITNSGSTGGVVGTNGNVTVVENSGTISGTIGVQMGGSVALRVDNQAGGTITGTGGTAITAVPRLFFITVNSGAINGNVVYNDAPATNLFTNSLALYVADGGTVNGNVTLGTTGFSSGIFLYRGNSTGVTGTISAGAGIDIYGRIYEASQSVAIGQNVLPSSFEFEAFVAEGPATTLTLTGTGTTVTLGGDGHVVNTATINAASTVGLYGGFTFNPAAVTYIPQFMAAFRRPQIQLGQPGSFFSIGFGNALGSFTNNGIINSEVSLATASFVNTGAINLQTASFGTTIHSAANSPFLFNNSGSITMALTGARYTDVFNEFEDGANAAIRLRSAINTTAAADITISNSGTIVGGLHGRFAAEDFVFTNSGSIEGFDNPGGYLSPGLVLWVGELNLVTGQNPESHFDAATASFTNTATGSIDHGTQLNLSAFVATVTNNGFLAGADARAALIVEQYLDAENVDATSFAFTNTGNFEGNVALELGTTDVTVNNSGDVAGQGYILSAQTFPEVLFGGGVAFEVNNETTGASTVSFTNTGNIVTTAHAQSGVVVAIDTDDDENELTNAGGTVSVINSGTISATGGATVVTPQFAPFLQPDQVLVNPIGALVVDASDVPGASVITIENQAGGLIEAGGAPVIATPNGYFPIPDVPIAGSTVALIALGQSITITNAGTIRGGAGTTFTSIAVLDSYEPRDGYLAGAIQTQGDEFGPDQVYIASLDTVINTATGVIVGSIDLGGNHDSLANNGQITGTVYLRDGDDTLANYGTLAGDVFFGAGNDSFTHSVSAIFTGSADGEAGEDKFFLDLTGGGTIDQTIYDRLLNFETFALIGQGQVDVDLGNGDDTFENEGTLEGEVNLGAGDNAFTNTGTVEGNVTGGAGADDLGNDGTIEGNIDLGAGSNLFDNTGNVVGDVTGGDNTDDVQNEGDIEGSVDLGSGDNVLDNSGTITGDVTSGSGADDVANDGTIEGDIDLGGGANAFSNTGEVAGDVTAGNDDDVVDNSGIITGDVNLDNPEQVVELLSAFTTRRSIAAAVIPVTGGDDTFTNDGTLDGDLFAGGGNDAITNSATITGLVDLGEGDDTLILQGAWAIGGSVTGGAGSDAVNLNLAGSTAPRTLNLAGFSAFETLALSGGTGIIQGSAAFTQINVGSGRLIGAAGSTITGNVAVASGATFGSAGQVTGNLTVASGATLSPGASPGVMSVTGNVALAGGSSTLFEFVPSPGQSDQLIIDGNLTIAAGAVLNLSGNRPLTPGIAYDMIIADSITGQFTIGTWDRTLVQGFLRYVDGTADDRLQLLGTFVFQSAAAPQPTAAVNYVNSLLVAGTASPALLAAINPLLGSNGFASAAAFTQLTPEPYASATQLAVETGLNLARTARSGIARGTGDEPALYGFGSASSASRGMAADATLGTSHARNRAQGLIGGLGFGSQNASLGGFVGYVEGRQRIAALGAQTNSDGMVAGLAGHIGAGAFNLDAMVGYDWSEADTVRTVPASGSVSSNYDLQSMVLDAAASFDLAMGGFTLTPGVGITHVAVRRGAASETGSAAYALNVDRDRHAATFLDGSIAISGSADSAFRPSASLGVRHQLEGDLVFASAGLLGSTARFIVPGAPRKKTVLTAGAGIEADVASNVSITASYDGEFGAGTGSTATLGLRARF